MEINSINHIVGFTQQLYESSLKTIDKQKIFPLGKYNFLQEG